MNNKSTIEELEYILKYEEDSPIEVLPNGEIRVKEKKSQSVLRRIIKKLKESR